MVALGVLVVAACGTGGSGPGSRSQQAGLASGTIEAFDDGCGGDPESDPHVENPFWIGGTDSKPNETFILTFETKAPSRPAGVAMTPGPSPAPPTGTTTAEGTFCAGPLTLPAGNYEVTYTDPSGNEKSKVYRVVEDSSPTPSLTTPSLTPSATG